MLQITREIGEAVVIQGGIVIRLMKIEGMLRCRFQLDREGKTSVFSMDLQEDVNIGPKITMQLQNIARGQIRLVFDAPRSITIDREEMCK